MIKRLDLEKEAILPLILKMSWPSIIAMTAMSVYNFIDTFWLARLSSQALAALTVCFPIQMIFAAIGVGTGIGAGSFSARMFGAGKILQARQTAGQIFPLSFFFGLIMIVFVLLFGDAILLAFGAFDEARRIASPKSKTKNDDDETRKKGKGEYLTGGLSGLENFSAPNMRAEKETAPMPVPTPIAAKII